MPPNQRRMKSSSGSSAETERLGAELGGGLAPGDIVLVSGELGSGKTTFVRGACRALGVTDPVTSPTFTIGHVYGGPVEVAHLDLYRLSEIDPSILEDYVTPERVAFIEWPSELEGATHRVRLEHAGGDRRDVTIL
jgi:tRNA threonylcarbamoyladenosine biosynthesis protein TsaE